MRAWTVSGAEGGGCGELGVTGNDEGAHSAASFFSVSGLCQQRGIQVSTEGCHHGLSSAWFCVRDLSLLVWVSVCFSVCVSELPALLQWNPCLSSMAQLLSWTDRQSLLM